VFVPPRPNGNREAKRASAEHAGSFSTTKTKTEKRSSSQNLQGSIPEQANQTRGGRNTRKKKRGTENGIRGDVGGPHRDL